MYPFEFPNLENESLESVSIKCPTDKEVTEHLFVKVVPQTADPEVDPLEILKLSKRLTLCVKCGTLRLLN